MPSYPSASHLVQRVCWIAIFGLATASCGEASSLGAGDDPLIPDVDGATSQSLEPAPPDEAAPLDDADDPLPREVDGATYQSSKPVPPGEERRRMDEARAALDEAAGLTGDVDSPAADPVPECALTVPSGIDSGDLAVFLPCDVSDDPGEQWPVHGLARPAPPSAASDQLVVHAVEKLAEGPTPSEEEAGYFNPIPGGLAVIQSVSVVDGIAEVSFHEGFATTNNLGTSGVSTVLLASLTSTVFQFDGIDGLRLTIDGDCDLLSEILQYDSCQILGPQGLTGP